MDLNKMSINEKKPSSKKLRRRKCGGSSIINSLDEFYEPKGLRFRKQKQ